MQNVMLKKVIASFLGLALIMAIILCFAPIQTTNADTVVWEKVDYEKYFVTEPNDLAYLYGGTVADIPYLRKFKYLYVFLQAPGGMGGSSSDGQSCFGGGSGGFIVAKINLVETDAFILELGKAGGKVEYGENDDFEAGEGFASTIWAFRSGTEQKPFAMDAAGCYGGKCGTESAPGKGGIAIKDEPKNNLIQLIYAQDGADGGQASHSFSVDLGFRTENFIYRPAGATPSGKGGGASVYHRGGDGGVLFKNGSDGSMGAGGGGAGRGATQGGYGGDAYMEVYGSNI